MIIHYGEDTPDILYLAAMNYHKSKCINYESLLAALAMYRYEARVSSFFKDKKEFGCYKYNWVFKKNYDYSFGPFILNEYDQILRKNNIELTFPMFILKDGVWNEWSPEFNVFKLCEGVK